MEDLDSAEQEITINQEAAPVDTIQQPTQLNTHSTSLARGISTKVNRDQSFVSNEYMEWHTTSKMQCKKGKMTGNQNGKSYSTSITASKDCITEKKNQESEGGSDYNRKLIMHI
jgi:hypothetical protein